MDIMDNNNNVVELPFADLPSDVKLKVFGWLRVKDSLIGRLVCLDWCHHISYTFRPKWSLQQDQPGALEALTSSSLSRLGTLSISNFNAKLPILSSTRQLIPSACTLIIGPGVSVENLKLLFRYYIKSLRKLELLDRCFAEMTSIDLGNLNFANLRDLAFQILARGTEFGNVDAPNFLVLLLQFTSHLDNLTIFLKQVNIPLLKRVGVQLVFDSLDAVQFVGTKMEDFRTAFGLFVAKHSISISNFSLLLLSDNAPFVNSLIGTMAPLSNVEVFWLCVLTLTDSALEVVEHYTFDALQVFRKLKSLEVWTNIPQLWNLVGHYKRSLQTLHIEYCKRFGEGEDDTAINRQPLTGASLLDPTAFPNLRSLHICGKMLTQEAADIGSGIDLSLITKLHMYMGHIHYSTLDAPAVVSILKDTMPHLKKLKWVNVCAGGVSTAEDELRLDAVQGIIAKLMHLKRISIVYKNLSVQSMGRTDHAVLTEIDNWCQSSDTVGVYGRYEPPTFKYCIFVDRRAF